MTWPTYSPACRKAVADLLKQGGSLSAYRANPTFGVEPKENSYAWKLEREVERRFKVKHAIAVNSGTAALHAGLASLDLRGGEVITSPYTFSATASAIVLAGGTPVFADVDPYTFCITPETVKPYVTRRTKAILPVHLFGGLADVPGLRAFGVPVIEDSCQAVGASRQGVYAGTFGLAGAYSFNGGKNVPAGEAGCLVTNDSEVALKARLLTNHGENFPGLARKVDRSGSLLRQVGLNYRVNELTACVAYHGLLELEERNLQRHRLAARFTQLMWASVLYRLPKFMSCLRLPTRLIFDRSIEQEHAWYVYPFQVKPGTRDAFLKRARRKGVAISGGYITPPLHHYPAFKGYAKRELPVVDELSFKTLCLISDFTPDKPLSHAEDTAKKIAEVLRG